ncbi:hypothetical protein GCM10027277_14210 [Pseudoduganella ginsengisoli]|uniref:DUF4440 domain-containing protein n=1 Tax=Pseudoduganella ginsengisoli TaxID=1462440 RepID=A0A6L6PWD5_9BURK|nr:nuclear transport factor 2 family protein [Pseudoduganella ginsengisoli]MTW01318.1 DUF4440 domain-containing protein [Pseudoduganella ginsengisoli]
MNSYRSLSRRTLLLVAALSATFVALILLMGGFIMYTQAIAADVPSNPLAELVRAHAEAQRNFDQARLQALTTDDYIEVSPVGELDSREKMLSFYAPGQQRPAPAVQVEAPVVRMMGDTALVVAKLVYTMAGQNQSFAMMASYVAQKQDHRWKLVSAHYTGIRPPKSS